MSEYSSGPGAGRLRNRGYIDIGGPLDWRRLAEQHRPRDAAALAAEMRRLHVEQRLTARDISAALRLPIEDVLEALRGEGRQN